MPINISAVKATGVKNIKVRKKSPKPKPTVVKTLADPILKIVTSAKNAVKDVFVLKKKKSSTVFRRKSDKVEIKIHEPPKPKVIPDIEISSTNSLGGRTIASRKSTRSFVTVKATPGRIASTPIISETASIRTGGRSISADSIRKKLAELRK
jgi:hypothetical protein